MVADLQQKGDGILADRCCAVGRHVHDRDALFPRVVVIHNVIARRKHRDQPDIRARVDRRAGDRRFVHDHDLRVADALRDQRGLGIRRAVIDRQLAKRGQLCPAQIAGIFRITVQYYKFHSSSLLFIICVPRIRGISDIPVAIRLWEHRLERLRAVYARDPPEAVLRLPQYARIQKCLPARPELREHPVPLPPQACGGSPGTLFPAPATDRGYFLQNTPGTGGGSGGTASWQARSGLR